MSTRSLLSGVNTNTALDVAGWPGVQSTAQDGGALNAVVLNAGAHATNEVYTGSYIEITGGTASGSLARILEYDGATKTAIVSPNFSAAPDNTSTFTIYGSSGVAQGGSFNTITLEATSSAIDDYYRGAFVRLQANGGRTQVRAITAYDGTTKRATVENNWEDVPVSNDIYTTFGESGQVQEAAGATTIQFAAAASATDDYYNKMCVEVLADAATPAAIGQVRTITDYVGATRTATVVAWTQAPSAVAVYRILPGWGGDFEPANDYHTVFADVQVQPGDYGVMSVTSSITSTGVNAAGFSVYTNKLSHFGQEIGGGEKGSEIHGYSITSSYNRFMIVTFGKWARGGLETRYTQNQDSTMVHEIEQLIGLRAETLLTRSILACRVEGTDVYRNLHSNLSGELAIDIPRTAFNDVRTAELTPQIQMNFVSEVGPQERIASAGGAQSTIRHESSQYYLRLGDSPITPAVAAGDYASMQSKRIGRYRPGLGGITRFTCIYAPQDDSLWQACGLSSGGNALEFGYGPDYSAAGTPAKFGINRGTRGRLEVRVLDLSKAPAVGTLTLTLPNFPETAAVGGTSRSAGIATADQVFTVDFAGTETLAEAARMVAEEINPAWGDYQWQAQNIGNRVVLRGVGVGPRDAAGEYAVDAGETGITVATAQRVQQGVADALPEVREINVSGAAAADDDVTLNFGETGNVVVGLTAAVHDSAVKVAWAIAQGDWAAVGWRAEIVSQTGTRIRFTSASNAPLSGAYTIDVATTGVTFDTFLQRRVGKEREDFWIFQENWNIDVCDGTGPSRFRIIPQRGNVYAINYQYLGFGGITYMVEDPKSAHLIPVHQTKYAGTEEDTHLENPHMPVHAEIRAADGDIADITHTMSCASWSFFTEGKIVHSGPKFARSNYIAAVTASQELPVLFLKHAEVFNDSQSQIGAFIQSINVGMDAAGNNITEIRIRLNPVVTVAQPGWEEVSYPSSPVLIATGTSDGTAMKDVRVGGGELIGVRSRAGDGELDFASLVDLELQRGDVLCVSCFANTGTPDITAAINWIEDH